MKNTRVSTIPMSAIFLSLLAGAVIILLLGKNPLSAYGNLLQGAGFLPKPSYAGYKNMLTDFTSYMNAWTPMHFCVSGSSSRYVCRTL